MAYDLVQIYAKREIVQRHRVNAKIGTLSVLEQNGRKLRIDVVVELLPFTLNFKISAKYFVWRCRMLLKMKKVNDVTKVVI